MTRVSTSEQIYVKECIKKMKINGWNIGQTSDYNKKKALYINDIFEFIEQTQKKEWKKLISLYPKDYKERFINTLHAKLEDIGTLNLLKHKIKIGHLAFFLCKFKPEHNLNPRTQKQFKKNIFRLIPELTYSPYATAEHLALTGKKAKAWRIDLVLFVNGLPVSTLELKSEFKQAVHNAIKQYKQTRLPKAPETKKPEPLLTFKRGALVHFAVSQYEVFMATKLAGDDTVFLPFNKGTKEGGKGNDVPEDQNCYATDYLWNEVLLPENLLKILGSFIHLQTEEKEDWEGRKYKKETLIFPRYHQWDVVNKLIGAAVAEGTGNKYLIQHSAGSGKSNSIAWAAHQLSTLYDEQGEKQFHSVIVVTDRTVLDDQLQDTIYQFEHADGMIKRINSNEGFGSKSDKLTKALNNKTPIIIVTIQTFSYVIAAIENKNSLKQHRYAIIADEAHSSQSGSTARKLKEVLMTEEADDVMLSSEDILDATMAARKNSNNLNYYAFTATPKAKTLELFGRLPNPNEPASNTNKPYAYHVYSMRQAIEEGFILDVLKNYTNYQIAYKLIQKTDMGDKRVDSKKAKAKLHQWARMHKYNISQKVKVIVEHYKNHVMSLLGGQAKAMVVTSSRKEAVRYKLAFDKYITDNNYQRIAAMVAFSGEVEFNDNDPDSLALLNKKFTENNMNPNLKGRDMRKAFDSDDYQVMLVANKFQTGFDQPKLCAMYVDKPLGGVECVQTLSRLNRTYLGKAESGTFVLDFFNEPDDILSAFQPYYQTAELVDITDPNLVFDLYENLRSSDILLWNEVEQFCVAFLTKKKSNAAVSNICKPAVDRWQHRYKSAIEAYIQSKNMFERTKKTKDAVLIANAENAVKECKQARDRLEIFKKDLGSFVRFFEFMSQIVDYEDKEFEKLSLFARYLRPLLHEQNVQEDEIDLSNIEMSHYRLSKIREQDIKLKKDTADYKLEPGNDVGTAKPKNKEEDFLSLILNRLNELFSTENLTDSDMINYAKTVRDKLSENEAVMTQINNNTRDQAMLGDFPQAIDDAVMDSNEAQQEMMMQYLSNPELAKGFARVVFDMLKG